VKGGNGDSVAMWKKGQEQSSGERGEEPNKATRAGGGGGGLNGSQLKFLEGTWPMFKTGPTHLSSSLTKTI
jgi:hypothetical protein